MDNLEKEKILACFNTQKNKFDNNETRDVNFRKEALLKLKKSILERTDEIYEALEADLGKSKVEVDHAEIGVVISEIDFAYEHLEEWLVEKETITDEELQPSELFISREPLGVSYIIGPFNYPLNLSLSPVVGAIASGCTAIIKPSENTPETAKVIEKIINNAFESNYLAVVQGAIEENAYLLSLPFDFIFFTGSPNVGKVVLRAAAEHLTPAVLELGGKCPTIICPDADLDQVVKKVTFGRFSNSGQTCVAPDYLLVHKDVKDELVKKLVFYVEQNLLNLGKIGKMISVKQLDRALNYLENTKGNVLTGGEYNKEMRYIQPAVVDNVNWDDILMQEELFSPILPIITFEDINTVHRLVNEHHPKPLAAYVFTKNYEQGRKILNLIPSGDSQINDVINHVTSNYLPFGGIGPSGMGEYHGKYSYKAFTHRKSLRISK